MKTYWISVKIVDEAYLNTALTLLDYQQKICNVPTNKIINTANPQ